jgi:hypothetical protein
MGNGKRRFFVPRTSKSEAEPAYLEIKRLLIDQLRVSILERRIFSLSYANGKNDRDKWYAEVGQPGQQERQYEVVAIFESNLFIIVNRTEHGAPGPIVLVNKDEVTAVEEFAA